MRSDRSSVAHGDLLPRRVVAMSARSVPSVAAAVLMIVAACAVMVLPTAVRTPAAAPLYLVAAGLFARAHRRSFLPSSPWGPVAGAAAAMALFQVLWGLGGSDGERMPMTVAALACLSAAVCLGGVGGWRGAQPWMSQRGSRGLMRLLALTGLAGFGLLGLLALSAQGGVASRWMGLASFSTVAVLVTAVIGLWPEARSIGRRGDLIGVLAIALHIGLCTWWSLRGQPLNDPVSGFVGYGALATVSNHPSCRRIGSPIDHRPLVTNPSTAPVLVALIATLALGGAFAVELEHPIVVAALALAAACTISYAARAIGSAPHTPTLSTTRSSRIRSDLAGAIIGGDIVLRYRPILRSSDGALAGVEGVPVWHHRLLGTIGDRELRREAAALGLSFELDMHLLDAAIPNIASIREFSGIDEPWISVPISLHSLQHPEVVDRVSEIVDAWDSSHDGLALALPELAAEPNITQTLHSLQDHGVWLVAPAGMELGDQSIELDPDLAIVESRLGSYDQRLVRRGRAARVVVAGLDTVDERRRALRLGADFVTGTEPRSTLAEILGVRSLGSR